MSFRRLVAFAILLAGPAHGQDAVSLRLVNEGSHAVTSLSLFPLNAAGEPVEDNLGGFYDPLLPGGDVRVDLAALCGPMLAVVLLSNGADLRVKLDTCADTVLRVSE